MTPLVALVAALARTATDSLVVEGNGRAMVFHVADIQKLGHVTVSAKTHDGTTHAFSGVPLRALLAQVGVKVDSLRGAGLAERLVVEASDGYKVVFALGELDTTLGDRQILLADREDGKPLPATDGAWRLVVPADGRPARSAHLVVALRVRTD